MSKMSDAKSLNRFGSPESSHRVNNSLNWLFVDRTCALNDDFIDTAGTLKNQGFLATCCVASLGGSATKGLFMLAIGKPAASL